MNEAIVALSGTEAGHRLALVLVILAAALHAVFGALQKGRHDPWLTRGAIDLSYGLMALPVALFLVPWPEPALWPVFAGMWVIHTAYKYAQGMAYTRGAYTVVYPVVRGTGPLVTVIAAGFVFGEHFTVTQWLGVAALTGGIFGLALYNRRKLTVARETLRAALFWAVLAGAGVAAYTTYDAWGIRAAQSPITFLAWFYVIDGLTVFPWVAAVRWRRMDNRPTLGPLAVRGIAGGVIGLFSFGSIMVATRLDKVGEAAVLRETSPVFAAVIGWLFLKETVGPVRAALMGLIAAGAVIVEAGG